MPMMNYVKQRKSVFIGETRAPTVSLRKKKFVLLAPNTKAMVRTGHTLSTQKSVLLVLVFLLSINLFGQHRIPSGFCMSANELKLAKAINQIRKEHGKKPIKISVSLTYVAEAHVKDLQINHPDTSICNLSSWSNKGKWTPVCYNPYVVDRKAMWDKPRELTRYPYNGYELAAYMQDGIILDSLSELWDTLAESLDMITTEGVWSKKHWEAMGVGISRNYASVWFGQREDREGAPHVCSKNREAAKERSIAKEEPKKKLYYLIVGSFPELRDAKEAVRRMKKNGFKSAGILVSEKRVRVYLSHYDNFNAAQKAKKKLPYSYRKVWILKK